MPSRCPRSFVHPLFILCYAPPWAAGGPLSPAWHPDERSWLLAGLLLAGFAGLLVCSSGRGGVLVEDFLQVLARGNRRGVGRVAGDRDFPVRRFRKVKDSPLLVSLKRSLRTYDLPLSSI